MAETFTFDENSRQPGEPAKFAHDGVWSDMQNGCWYEVMTDSVWRKTEDGWVKVA